jgi:hypothetical protein
MLFKEIIAVYSENHAKPINTKCSITDCQSRWFIYLPLGLTGLSQWRIAIVFTTYRHQLAARRDSFTASFRKIHLVLSSQIRLWQSEGNKPLNMPRRGRDDRLKYAGQKQMWQCGLGSGLLCVRQRTSCPMKGEQLSHYRLVKESESWSSLLDSPTSVD